MHIQLSLRASRGSLFPLAWFIVGAALLTLAACSASPTAAPAGSVVLGPEPSAALSQILNDCWHVKQMNEIDAKKQEHIDAFACAQPRLETLLRTQPDMAEAHRVLAWGYLYARQDAATAIAEYKKAADIYHKQGQKVDEAEALRRMGLIQSVQNQAQGCATLKQAQSLDPQNAQVTTALTNLGCLGTAVPATAAPTR